VNPLKTIAKSDTELRVGNYLVLFGGRDLAGEFFTKNTRFDSNYTDLGILYEDFEHGMDTDGAGNNTNNVLGIVDWKSAKIDDNGIFVERILNRRAEYMQFLMPLIDMGVMGSSSEAIGGQVRKKSNGEIVEWPLMRDSLTVTPMEPRMVTANILTAAKALVEVFPNSKSLAKLAMPPASKGIEAIATLGDAEDFLRDAGFARTEAKALLSQIKNLGRRDADAGDLQEIAEVLKRQSEQRRGQRDAEDELRQIEESLKRRKVA
jgi:hypothetical protein